MILETGAMREKPPHGHGNAARRSFNTEIQIVIHVAIEMIFPFSTNCITAMAVNSLHIEPGLHNVAGVMGCLVCISA